MQIRITVTKSCTPRHCIWLLAPAGSIFRCAASLQRDPNLIGPNGDSLLHQAVIEFCEACVRLLVENYHANVNVQCDNGDTPAKVAVAMGRFDLVAYFLQKGLNNNLQDLALSVQIRQVPAESDAMKHKVQVIDMLKARGVQYPDPRYRPRQPLRAGSLEGTVVRRYGSCAVTVHGNGVR